MNKYILFGGLCLILFGGFISLNSTGQATDPNSAPPAPTNQNVSSGPAQPPVQPLNDPMSQAQPQMGEQMNSNGMGASTGSNQEVKQEIKAENKIKPIIPQNLIGVPAKSKVVFKKDLIIPPSQTEVQLGSINNNGFKTECKIKLATFSPNLRKVPSGTAFKVIDTRVGYGSETELLLESTSLSSMSCITYRPGNPSQLMSTNDFKSTNYYQAQKAAKGTVSIELNSEPDLITN